MRRLRIHSRAASTFSRVPHRNLLNLAGGIEEQAEIRRSPIEFF